MPSFLDIDYLVVNNVNSDKVGRIGDYGNDSDGLPYVLTRNGWRCLQEDRRCAIFWQRKYMELLKDVNRKKRKVKNN